MDAFVRQWPDVNQNDRDAALEAAAGASAMLLSMLSRLALAVTRRDAWRRILMLQSKAERHAAAARRGRHYGDRANATLWVEQVWAHRQVRHARALGAFVRARARVYATLRPPPSAALLTAEPGTRR